MLHDQIVQDDKAIQGELEKEVTRLDQREKELIQWSTTRRSRGTMLTRKWGDIPAVACAGGGKHPNQSNNWLPQMMRIYALRYALCAMRFFKATDLDGLAGRFKKRVTSLKCGVVDFGFQTSS